MRFGKTVMGISFHILEKFISPLWRNSIFNQTLIKLLTHFVYIFCVAENYLPKRGKAGLNTRKVLIIGVAGDYFFCKVRSFRSRTYDRHISPQHIPKLG